MPEFSAHAAADGLAKLFELRRRSSALIDEEIAVELGNLRRADRENPRKPASSMSCQDLCPGGFLNVEPPVRVLTGWVDSRVSVISSMAAEISSPVARRRPAEAPAVKIRSSGAPQWR